MLRQINRKNAVNTAPSLSPGGNFRDAAPIFGDENTLARVEKHKIHEKKVGSEHKITLISKKRFFSLRKNCTKTLKSDYKRVIINDVQVGV